MSSQHPGVTILSGMVLLLLPLSVQATLKLGVHPFKPPAKLMEAFTPLANYLEQQLGEPVKVVIAGITRRILTRPVEMNSMLQKLTPNVTKRVSVQDSDYDNLHAVHSKMKDLGVQY